MSVTVRAATPGPPPLFLIGFMAAGKTTLGKAVARLARRPFVDTDELIESMARMSIPEIFRRFGQDEFRRLETLALASLARRDDSPVIACGGGLPCREENRRIMLDAGTVVWLQAPAERLVERLLLAPGTRPLVDGKSCEELGEYVAATMAERSPAYSHAHHTFDSSRLESADEIEHSAQLFIDSFCR